MEFSAKQIATFIQGEIVGDENAIVHTFAKIEEGIPGAISFLSNPKYIPYLYETQSSIVLVNKDFTPEQEVKATMIKVDNAYESLAKLLNLYEQSKPKRTGIDPRAYVAEKSSVCVAFFSVAVLRSPSTVSAHTLPPLYVAKRKNPASVRKKQISPVNAVPSHGIRAIENKNDVC